MNKQLRNIDLEIIPSENIQIVIILFILKAKTFQKVETFEIEGPQ